MKPYRLFSLLIVICHVVVISPLSAANLHLTGELSQGIYYADDDIIADTDCTIKDNAEVWFMRGGDVYLSPEFQAEASSSDIFLKTLIGDFSDIPVDSDLDADGLPDWWEILHDLKAYEDDSGADPDSDNATNLQEYEQYTDPNEGDTDSDGVDDGAEYLSCMDAYYADTDFDGIVDGDEVINGTDPCNDDTDGDGMNDGFEVAYAHCGLDPEVSDNDTDGDGMADLFESHYGFNPSIKDADIQSDTWVAVDALGRQLDESSGYPNPNDRKDKFIGIFYDFSQGTGFETLPIQPKYFPYAIKIYRDYLNGDWPIRQLKDNSKILDPYSPYYNEPWGPPDGSDHFIYEAELGYYLIDDDYVIRKHCRMLADAGVDVLMIDLSNILTWYDSYMKLCRIFQQIRNEGGKTPYISFFTGGYPVYVAQEVYNELFSKGLYSDLWFPWDNPGCEWVLKDSPNPDTVTLSGGSSQQAATGTLRSNVENSCGNSLWINCTAVKSLGSNGNFIIEIFDSGALSGNVASGSWHSDNGTDNGTLKIDIDESQTTEQVIIEEILTFDSLIADCNGNKPFMMANSIQKYAPARVEIEACMNDILAAREPTNPPCQPINASSGTDCEWEHNDIIKDFFTLRDSQTWGYGNDNFGDGFRQWVWMDGPCFGTIAQCTLPLNWFSDSLNSYGWVVPNEPEQVAVCAAMFPLGNTGRSYPYRFGYSELTDKGIFFDNMWQRAHTIDPNFVFITEWNFTNVGNYGGLFIDRFNHERSRTIEPMKGGHTDNYYFQMADHIRRFKGARQVETADTFQTISIDGAFSDWDTITPEFRDTFGDTFHRDYPGFAYYKQLTNTTGRNDFVWLKSAMDGDNVYFYAKCKDALTSYTDPNWMQLFINIDESNRTGWEGYDYVINRSRNSTTAKLEKYVGGIVATGELTSDNCTLVCTAQKHLGSKGNFMIEVIDSDSVTGNAATGTWYPYKGPSGTLSIEINEGMTTSQTIMDEINDNDFSDIISGCTGGSSDLWQITDRAYSVTLSGGDYLGNPATGILASDSASLTCTANPYLGEKGNFAITLVDDPTVQTPTVEVITLSMPGYSAFNQADYFILNDSRRNKTAVWFDKYNTDEQPDVTSLFWTRARRLEVAISSGETGIDIAQKVYDQINAADNMTVVNNGDGSLTITMEENGDCHDAVSYNRDDTGTGAVAVAIDAQGYHLPAGFADDTLTVKINNGTTTDTHIMEALLLFDGRDDYEYPNLIEDCTDGTETAWTIAPGLDRDFVVLSGGAYVGTPSTGNLKNNSLILHCKASPKLGDQGDFTIQVVDNGVITRGAGGASGSWDEITETLTIEIEDGVTSETMIAEEIRSFDGSAPGHPDLIADCKGGDVWALIDSVSKCDMFTLSGGYYGNNASVTLTSANGLSLVCETISGLGITGNFNVEIKDTGLIERGSGKAFAKWLPRTGPYGTLSVEIEDSVTTDTALMLEVLAVKSPIAICEDVAATPWTIAGTSDNVTLSGGAGGWLWESVTDNGTDVVAYSASGKEIELAIPRTALDCLGSDCQRFAFKWADNIQKDGDIIEFSIHGDSAPNRRFNYLYINSYHP